MERAQAGRQQRGDASGLVCVLAVLCGAFTTRQGKLRINLCRGIRRRGVECANGGGSEDGYELCLLRVRKLLCGGRRPGSRDLRWGFLEHTDRGIHRSESEGGVVPFFILLRRCGRTPHRSVERSVCVYLRRRRLERLNRHTPRAGPWWVRRRLDLMLVFVLLRCWSPV